MSGDERTDPYPNFRFRVEIGTLVVAGFSEVRGLAMSIEDGPAETATSLPAWQWLLERDLAWGATPPGEPTGAPETSSPTLKLRRGVTDDLELWGWFREWIDGTGEAADARVVLLDGTGREVRGWRCKCARPVRWSGPTLVASDSGIAIETFELAHDGIETVDVN